MSRGEWTIDELVQRVADALASSGVRAPNGRVTPLPDRRVIRWYATIGLLDRPVRTQGRTARYGERHLLQLMAVKRRQAEGRSLAEIQAELTGATDATLRRAAGLPDQPDRADSTVRQLAGLPDQADRVAAGPTEPAPTRRQFWRTQPAAAASPVAAGAAPAGHTVTAAAMEPGSAEPTSPFASTPSREAPFHSAVRHRLTSEPLPAPVYPVPLPGGATLVLPAQPDQADLAAIRSAAEPLLDLLASRGLLPDPGSVAATDPLVATDSFTDHDSLSDYGARSPR